MGNIKSSNDKLQMLKVEEMIKTNGGLYPIAWFILGLIAGELNDRNNVNDFWEGYNSI